MRTSDRPLSVACALAFATALSLAHGAAPARAQSATAGTSDADLKKLEAEIASQRERINALKREALDLATEEAGLRHQLIDAAAKVQDSEQQLSDVEERLFALVGRENDILARLAKRRAAIADLMGALEMLALNRPPTLGVSPDDAAEAARSAMILNTLIPEVRGQAAELEAELTSLAAVREGIQKEQRDKVATARSLETEREALEKLVGKMSSRRTEVMATAAAETGRLQQLAAQAKDLKGFLTTLAEQGMTAMPRLKPDPNGQAIPVPETKVSALTPGTSLKGLRGKLRPPVAGELSLAFGKTTLTGTQSQGLVFVTRRTAQVVSPCEGDVLFSGQFMGYGLLLIIGTADGYHFVLSGMNRIDTVAGQRLLAGEPVGIMGGTGPQSSPSGLPELYVELRHHGEPVDPLPWLAVNDRKVSG